MRDEGRNRLKAALVDRDGQTVPEWVRASLEREGVELVVHDCTTRAELAAHKDYYLMTLPRTGDAAEQITMWVDEAVQGKRPLQDLMNDNYSARPTTTRIPDPL